MTASPVTLRPAEPADAAFLYDSFVASRERELGLLPADMREILARQQYAAFCAGTASAYPDAQVYIVEASENGQQHPAGTITLAETAEALWVVDLAIVPGQRGAGLGTAILRELWARCRAEGRIMRGSVSPYNPARLLYARLGIRELPSTGGFIPLEWRPDADGAAS